MCIHRGDIVFRLTIKHLIKMASYQKPERTIFEKLPFEIVDLSESNTSKTNIRKDIALVGPKNYVVSNGYKKCGLDIYNFEARADDVYLVGCKRTGTTLTSELVWLIENYLDFEGAAKDILDYRVPHIDYDVIGTLDLIEYLKKTGKEHENIQKYQKLTLKDLSEMKGRRILRSHLAFSLISPHIFEIGAKVIYCARNPKDMLVSLYNLDGNVNDKLATSNANFHDYIDDFKNDLVFPWPYIEHIKEAWERRHEKNVLFLFYEDTLKDKRGTIEKMAHFLGKNLSQEQIDKLEDHVKIENFKNNTSVNCEHFVELGVLKDKNKFIRRGKSGGWKELFDEELEKEFDQIVEEKLKGTDLRFPNV